ncbi:MAG: heme ABC transporter permease [Gammaproteobacteria bacterium]
MKKMWAYLERLWHRLGSPRHFHDLSGQWLPWLAVAALLLLGTGLVWGLLFAPADYQQGNSVRIIYLHVPAASLALSGYLAMAVCGIVVLVWRMKMAEIVLQAIAVPGAVLCAIALFSGAVWGKPTWGTYWFWDARITSMLILLFLYVGIIALGSAIASPVLAARATSVLAIVGAVNIPIIRYSVEWWNTLHQPATFKVTGKSAMAPEMLQPLVVSALGFYVFFALVVILRTRNIILEREAGTRWVQDLAGGK